MQRTNESQPLPALLLPTGDERQLEPPPVRQPTGAATGPSTGAALAALVTSATPRPSPPPTTPRPAVDEQPRSEQSPTADGGECGGTDGGDFPWIVVLEHGGPDPAGGRKRTLSKGVLIDRLHVLTTVSSVQNSYPSWVLTGVRLGDAPTHRESAPAAGRRRANSTLVRLPIGMVFLHETKDIALIRLAGDGVRPSAGGHVQPICMPREDHRLEAFALASHVCEKAPAAAAAAEGRGRAEPRGGGRASRSQLQPVALVAGDDCNRLLEPFGARLAGKSFCAWENGTDSCTGPLGGPVVAKIRDRYHVVGLRSYLQTETEVNGSELPSIYVRIGGFRKWIAAVIQAGKHVVTEP